MSLDIEGAEFDALSTFPWEEHIVSVMTVERPSAKLGNLLGSRNYSYVCNHGFSGTHRLFVNDQLWMHRTALDEARMNLPGGRKNCRDVFGSAADAPASHCKLPRDDNNPPGRALSAFPARVHSAHPTGARPISAAPHINAPRGNVRQQGGATSGEANAFRGKSKSQLKEDVRPARLELPIS